MDESNQAALKTLLQQWINERQSALREQVLAALRDAQDRMVPDDALMELALAQTATPPAPAPRDSDADLGAGLDLMAEAATQGEVLKRLLEGAMRFCERSALFVIKQGIANLYAQRGFEADHPKLGVAVVPPPELEVVVPPPELELEVVVPPPELELEVVVPPPELELDVEEVEDELRDARHRVRPLRGVGPR